MPSLEEMAVNTMYYFSISSLRTDPHSLIVEVNGMGWQVGRNEVDFTGINRSGVGKAGEYLLKYLYLF